VKIDILTLFPLMFDGFLRESIVKRAIDSKKVKIRVHNLRDYSNDKHQKVDDTPYGGGAGMVLMCQPIHDAINDLKRENTKVILMTPQGVPYNQKLAYELSKEEHLLIVCGHYEGFDERVRSMVDMEISIGDYVLTGGELPSMILTDSITRLVDGVIDNDSHKNDSFNNNLLDYPTYTKPRDFNGIKVPDVLLSGNHEEIEKWRKEQCIIKTMEKRPDLIEKNEVIDYKEEKEVKNMETPKSENVFITRNYTLGETVIMNYSIPEGYKTKPKGNKRENTIEIEQITFIKNSLIEKVVKKNINKKFEKLLEQLEESEDGDSAKVLDEANRIRGMILNTYLKYVGNTYAALILEKLQVIMAELQLQKLNTHNLGNQMQNDYEEEYELEYEHEKSRRSR